jgi:hypothetical protein
MILLTVFLLGGVLAAGLGLWLCLKTQRLVARGRIAEGRYIDATWDSSGQGERISQYGAIEFQTDQGQVIRFQGRVGTPFEAQKVGQQVSVLYDPSHPEDAVVHSFVELWLPGLIFLTVGLTWIGVAAILMLLR